MTGGAGVAMAFEPGHGRTAVPVRSALAGSVIAVAALAAAAVFGASLIGLVSTPHDYGQNWVQEVDFNFGTALPPRAPRWRRQSPKIGGYAGGDYGQLTIDGKIVPAIGLDQVRGSGYLTLLAGRAPTAPDEIALGAQTLRAIGARLGQTIRSPSTRTPPAALAPRTGCGSSASPCSPRSAGAASPPLAWAPGRCCRPSCCPPGRGRAPPTRRAGPAASATTSSCCGTGPAPTWPPRPPRSPQVLQASGCPVGSCIVPPVADQRPGDIKNYASIRDTPLALAVVLAVLAVGTLAHVLLTGVRRRRRDLALLKTLGFTRRQVLGTVAWEASAFAAVALLVGLPLGVVAGRWAWAVFASAAGVSTAATVPLATVLLAIPATLLAANLIAAAPGWEAARLRPAIVLRTE